MSRITDLSAVVISARHCNEFDCKKCRARSPLDAAQVVAFPQVRKPPHARPEGVMPNDHLDSAHRASRGCRLHRLPAHGIAGLARDRLRAARLPARRNQRRTANPEPSSPESFSGSSPPERGDARCLTTFRIPRSTFRRS